MRPVVVVPPSGAARPLVVEVPHAGLHVPPEVRRELAVGDETLRRDADRAVDRLYGRAPLLGATLLFTEVSRFVVDLNRDPDDVDRLSVPHHPRPRADAPRGLVWRLTTEGEQVLAAPLSLASWRRRVERYYVPYHRALDEALGDLQRRFGRVLLLSGHSMPSIGRPTHDDPGIRRADVVPGDLEGRSCAPRVTETAVDHFRAAGLRVTPNTPYKGGGTTQRHGRPSEGRHALQLELNRDLYLDEASGTVDEARLARLESLCLSLVDRLAALAGGL